MDAVFEVIREHITAQTAFLERQLAEAVCLQEPSRLDALCVVSDTRDPFAQDTVASMLDVA